MLGESVRLALDSIGLESVVVGYVEREAAAAGCLLARMENEAGGSAPVWDDARTFYADRDRRLESVDVLCAGYPCQPFSHAGRRRGHRDPRHLWPVVRGAIARMRPGIVFLENVSGHVGRGAGKVVCDLDRLGYRATCGLFTSAEAGAGHRRERLFILGLDDSEGNGWQRFGVPARWREERNGALDAGGRGERVPDGLADSGGERLGPRDAGPAEPAPAQRPDPDSQCAGLADLPDTDRGCRERGAEEGTRPRGCGRRGPASGGGAVADRSRDDERRGSLPDQDGQGVPIGGCGGALADGDHAGLASRRDAGPAGVGRKMPVGSGGALPHYAPARDIDLAAVSKALAKARSDDEAETLALVGARTAYAVFGDWEIVARLDPALMPSVESSVRRMADGLATAADQLRLAGNGVDALAGAFAFLALFACLWDWE